MLFLVYQCCQRIINIISFTCLFLHNIYYFPIIYDSGLLGTMTKGGKPEDYRSHRFLTRCTWTYILIAKGAVIVGRDESYPSPATTTT